MYTWVPSEAWLLIGILTLFLFLWKGIDYSQGILSPRNRVIAPLIPISVCQIAISFFEIKGIHIELQNLLTNILILYGVLFFIYIYYVNYHNPNTRDGTIRNMGIIIFAILMYIAAEVYDYIWK